MDSEYVVSVGSRYRVNHGDEEQTEGVFKGFSAMGTETAMVFELDGGTLRFINVTQIIYFDLLEAVPSERAEKRVDPGSVYYG